MNHKNQHLFAQHLLHWHKTDNKRTMPWKNEKDPYKIWLSEVILQQTRVEQGLQYYINFTKKYPTIVDLANANDDAVFKLWEGLGYYSRCKNLLFTARIIRDDYKGIFPKTYKEIIALKGVGSYTAAAIASFAYSLPYAVLDGNVYRILSRVFEIDLAIDSKNGKDHFTKLSQQLIDTKNAAKYNQAIMDLGATICKPKQPLCDACPLQKICKAYKNNTIEKFPIKEKKLVVSTRYFYYFIMQHKNKIIIGKRTEKDIWQNLFQFYLLEMQQQQAFDNNTTKKVLNDRLSYNGKIAIQSISKIYQQKLTHRIINGCFITVELDVMINIEDYFWIDKNDLKKYSFPKFINSFLDND